MSKEVAVTKRKAPAKDARPAKKVKADRKSQPEVANPNSKAAGDASKSRKRAADLIEEAAPAVQAPVEDSLKSSKKVKIVEPEPVPTSISDKSSTKDKKEKKMKKTSVERAVVLVEQDDETVLPPAAAREQEDEEEGDVAALLAGFSSDDSDGEAPADKDGIALEALPEPVLDKKAKKALAKAAVKKKSGEQDTPGTIYIGRIPHGFYEQQMRAYFTQFGQILNLRLSRNKKTGASKHYAFIQFASTEVADIVARTMNNYLMFNHILKVRVMPEEQVHAELWKGANKRYKVVPRNMLERKSLEEKKGRKDWEKKVTREERKREEKKRKLEASGVEYEWEATKLRKVEDVPLHRGVKKAKAVTETLIETENVPNAEIVAEVTTEKRGEDLVKAIANGVAVVDEAAADIENVIKEDKKSKKEKNEKSDKSEKVKVKVSKKVKA